MANSRESISSSKGDSDSDHDEIEQRNESYRNVNDINSNHAFPSDFTIKRPPLARFQSVDRDVFASANDQAQSSIYQTPFDGFATPIDSSHSLQRKAARNIFLNDARPSFEDQLSSALNSFGSDSTKIPNNENCNKGLSTAKECFTTNNISSSIDEMICNGIDDKDAATFQEDDSSVIKRKLSPAVFNRTEFLCIKIALAILFFSLSGSQILMSASIFTCNHFTNLCLPQLTVKLTDKSPAAKTAILTVKEALKVLSYLALDLGDNNSELDALNSRFDNYYQSKVIDTFSVNSLYQLNFLGFCRVDIKTFGSFCMRSYGLDLLSVFVRDVGAQLGVLTNTNVDIMGESFAIAYELAISGFNELTNKQDRSLQYVDYAILLQNFSKGLNFLIIAEFMIGGVLTLGAIILMIFNNQMMKGSKKVYPFKKVLLFLMLFLIFINLFISFLVCSLTLEYILKISDIGENIGIAEVSTGIGFITIWITLVLQLISTVTVVYLLNGFRKRYI